MTFELDKFKWWLTKQINHAQSSLEQDTDEHGINEDTEAYEAVYETYKHVLSYIELWE